MNLIEKLGGYEKAKQILISCEFHGRKDLRVPVAGGFIHIVVDFLEKDLLDYRKEHNIFEVGDKVVYKGEAGLNGLFEIERLTKTGKPKTVKTERFGNFPCRYCEVQHATDEEIQAGHRL